MRQNGALTNNLGALMAYLLKRSLQMLLILLVLSAALFGLLSSMPGNPIDLMITSNPQVKPEDVIRLKKLRGLDRPWYVQYVRWLWGYPEPARPPTLLAIDPVGKEQIEIDLSDYLVDPNFSPKTAEVLAWLSNLWPAWVSSKAAQDIKKASEKDDLSALLLAVATVDAQMQNRLVRVIEKESAKGLKVSGLFGSKVNGFKLLIDPNLSEQWFLATNSYGQEKSGHVVINNSLGQTNLLTTISPQIVEDEKKPYLLNLEKFLVDPSKDVKFTIIKGPGSVSKEGYTNLFDKNGQTVVQMKAVGPDGQEQSFAFDVEHGVVGHEHRFNRGFLYFFLGDQNALGFSQTYKRPVYELLFGSPPVCGDGRVDSGETCDDGNNLNGDGCDESCFKANDDFIKKADVSVSGYIVRSGRIGNTVQLMLPALLLSLLFAIPLGVFSAYRQYSTLDYIINFLAFVGISLPVFWFGIMMVYLFAETFQFFPAGGVQTPDIYGQGTGVILLDRLKHAILPTIVLSIFYTGRWLRFMRASMLEVLPKDYIRTARAKGLSERIVILKHAFRNALIPVVTVLTLSIPSLFGGAVLTETVFSWPGVGRLQYESVMNSDYYVAIVVFLVSAVLVMVGNLLADIVYVLVDPRIRKK